MELHAPGDVPRPTGFAFSPDVFTAPEQAGIGGGSEITAPGGAPFDEEGSLQWPDDTDGVYNDPTVAEAMPAESALQNENMPERQGTGRLRQLGARLLQPFERLKSGLELRSRATADEAESYTQPLDSETVAALETELSAFTPLQTAEVKAGLRKTIQYALETYDEFIPETTKAHVAAYADRLIVVSPEDFAAFIRAWWQFDDDTFIPEGAEAVYITRGQLTVIADWTESWATCSPQLIDGVAAFLGESDRLAEPVKEFIAQATRDKIIAHEPYHSLEATVEASGYALRHSVSEMGAYYYHVTTGRALGKKEILDPNTHSAVDFYTGLIQKYGDDMHRLYFGTLGDESRRNQILREFTPKIVHKIFPPEEYGDLHSLQG